MIGKPVICDTCKKLIELDKSPWCVCTKHIDFIPDELFQIDFVGKKNHVKCPHYEFNPNWNA